MPSCRHQVIRCCAATIICRCLLHHVSWCAWTHATPRRVLTLPPPPFTQTSRWTGRISGRHGRVPPGPRNPTLRFRPPQAETQPSPAQHGAQRPDSAAEEENHVPAIPPSPPSFQGGRPCHPRRTGTETHGLRNVVRSPRRLRWVGPNATAALQGDERRERETNGRVRSSGRGPGKLTLLFCDG